MPAIPRRRRFMALANPPTAVFAATDNLAFGVLKACDRVGCAFPIGLPLSGSTTSASARSRFSALTSVDGSGFNIGQRAMTALGRSDRQRDPTHRPNTAPSAWSFSQLCVSVGPAVATQARGGFLMRVLSSARALCVDRVDQRWRHGCDFRRGRRPARARGDFPAFRDPPFCDAGASSQSDPRPCARHGKPERHGDQPLRL